jgi:hypothetical protein
MNAYSAKTALLGNLIDYAGTFPPAALPLEKALQQACAYRRESRHPWLLSKIVVTIADLKKLTPRAWFEAGSDGTPLPFTVIGSAVEKPADLARHCGFEMREVRRFNEKFVDSSLRQRVVAYETRLPPEVTSENVGSLITDAIEAALSGDSLGLDLFIEVPIVGASWQNILAHSTQAMSDWAEANTDGVGQPGIKIRTGGKTPPSAEQLAQAIVACTENGLRFKATQGLHHPVTHQGEFGFVNLFASFAFLQTLGSAKFDPKTVESCLTDSNKTAFKFSGNQLSWKGFTIEAEQIETARRRHGGTFGSCSLAEPDEFLATELTEEMP